MQDEIEDQVQSVTGIADNTEAEEPLTPPSLESAPVEPIEEETVSVVSSNNVEEKPKAKKWKVKRDTYAETYALAAEVEALKQKNASMEELLHKSLEAGNYHYGTVAMGLLDKAKANLAKALGEGDVEAVATATAEIAHATIIVNDAKRAPQVNLRDNGGLQEPAATIMVPKNWTVKIVK